MTTGQARTLAEVGAEGAPGARRPAVRRGAVGRVRALPAVDRDQVGPSPRAATGIPRSDVARPRSRTVARPGADEVARLADSRQAESSVPPPRSRPRGTSAGTGGRDRVGRLPMVVTGILALVGLVFATGAFLDLRYRGEALPGVTFEGAQLGGLAPLGIAGVVTARAADLVGAPVTFALAGREWRPTAKDVGLRIDTAAIGEAAAGMGRAWAWPLRWLAVAVTPAWRPAVPLRAEIDRAVLTSYLDRVAAEIDRAPVEPSVSARNGQVIVVPGTPGTKVDVAATARAVRVPTSTADRQAVALVVASSSPRVTPASAAEAQRVAQRTLASPLRVIAGDKSWTLTVAQLEEMLEFRREPGADGDRIVAVLGEARVAAFVRTVADQVDRAPQDGQLRWDGKAIAFVKDGLDGYVVDQPGAVRAIVDGAASEGRQATAPVRVAPAGITAARLAAQGIKDLVSTGTSRFAGSPPERANNIKVAAMKLHHQFVAPGATFSFLGALGPITKEEGYLEGLTIQGDATVPGIGGGVCQVSTTLFRAAFHAGVPVLERHQHVYRVPYYEQDGSPVGFDAAVYDPGVDFRFRNDTGAPLLLHATIDAATSSIAFRLFGETTGREVKLAASRANEKPAPPPAIDVADPKLDFGVRKQVEWKATGVEATIRRAVTVMGKPGLADTFSSRYVPWQEKWAIGTGLVTAKTPPTIRAAIAQGTLAPGSPGVIEALRALVSPPPPAEAADDSGAPVPPGTSSPAPAAQSNPAAAPTRPASVPASPSPSPAVASPAGGPTAPTPLPDAARGATAPPPPPTRTSASTPVAVPGAARP